DHSLTVCNFLGVMKTDADFVSDIRESSSKEIDTWGGATAATVLVVWGTDDWSFDMWQRPHIARLWEEASLWVGAMNSIVALPVERQIPVLERLFEWEICEPESPLDLALQLLKAHFAPDLVVLSSSIGPDKCIFTFAPHTSVPIKGILTSGQVRAL